LNFSLNGISQSAVISDAAIAIRAVEGRGGCPWMKLKREIDGATGIFQAWGNEHGISVSPSVNLIPAVEIPACQ